jgi:PAS domain S-box-containing protein
VVADRRTNDDAFRLLVDSAQDYAIFLLDTTGHVRTWNAGAARMKGYLAQEIIGQSLSRFYPPEDQAAGKVQRLLDAARRDGRVEDQGWRLRKDGTRFWADVVITALRDRDGTLIGFGKVTRDLSERKRAQEELLRLEVARARAESRAADALEKVRARDEFISVASHELRTPLAAARLHVESLRRLLARTGPPEPGRVEHKLQRVIAQVDRLEGLVDKLLDTSRVALGQLILERSELDLVELVRGEVTRLGEELEAARCTLRLQAPDAVRGQWDGLRLQQVVTNLLTNAMKYGSGQPIEVEVAAAGERARVTVTDQGIGIAPADHERIFHRFERAVSERNFAGLGLGLWITRQIVEALGGTITVDSALGQGARFTVELPR